MNTQTLNQTVDPHEYFLQRAGRIFPVSTSLFWTSFERAVFNSLMARLIFKHGYDGISDAMLYAASQEMQSIVDRYAEAERAEMHRINVDELPPHSRTGYSLQQANQYF